MASPVVLSFKIFSEHTLNGYDMRDGVSPYSIEKLPNYKVKVQDNGDIVLDEDAPIVKCVFGRFRRRDRECGQIYDITGLNCASIAFACEYLERSVLRKMTFAHRPDESYHFSRGKEIPEGMTAEEIDAKFLGAIEYNGAEVETFVKSKIREKKEKRVQNRPNTLDDTCTMNFLVSPSLKPSIPEQVKAVYTHNKPIVSFHENNFLHFEPASKHPTLYAMTENSEYWAQIGENRSKYKAVTVFSHRLAKQNLFNEWVKTRVLDNVFTEHSTDFKEAYESQPSDQSVFVSDCQSLNDKWISDFKDEEEQRIYVNFMSQIPIHQQVATGPGTMFASPSLSTILKDHSRSMQVFQGKVAAHVLHNKEMTLNVLPINCFTLRHKPVCEIGIVGETEHIWEHGKPDNGDYLSIWVDQDGRVEGIRTVGHKEQKKALILHEAMLMGITPKKHRFFTDPAQWDLLQKLVTHRLNNGLLKSKTPSMNRR